ncbi:MAG TPA: SRPBCC family protein [Egibacteraceae bacterium]|nr:SRPBCC family protein [Egibacteraceae bacterium]
MRIRAWDSVFVRARRADVHLVVADVAGWGLWWPGATSRAADGRVALTLRPPGLIRRPQHLLVEVTENRAAKGIRMRYTGDFDGAAEWYYLDEPTGSVVHYLLDVDVADRGGRRRLVAHRATVRAALHRLKDRLEAGRTPGSEPDPALLAHQHEALAVQEREARARARRTVAPEEG